MALPRSLMPSIQELAAFEAAGRHGSFTRAAEELALTQSAISKQVRQLETTLGVMLFERAKGRIVLTANGRALLISATKLLGDYATATHSVIASGGSEATLKLGVLPTFASRWLIPRLPDFLERSPSVMISVVTTPEPFDLGARSVDAAIHYGRPDWAQAEAIYLCDEAVIAVTSRAYARRLGLSNPGDLVRATLLQQATRPNFWRDWFEATGTEHPYPLRGPLFDQFAMTSEAAAAGMGVALMPSFLVERELSEGSLVTLDAPVLPGAGSYYLVVPVGRRHEPVLASFIAWLIDQARASQSASRPALIAPAS